MIPKADFSDLVVRIVSGVAIIALAIGEIWVGGAAFGVLLIVTAGLMGWEISRMHTRRFGVPVLFGALLSGALALWMFLSPLWAGLAALPVAALALSLHAAPLRVIGWALAVTVACATLQVLRSDFGLAVTLWLLLVVMASDVGGYFAGRVLGGPKILPRISPKKTWSGTLGGWALAAIVGGVALSMGVGNAWIVPLSVVTAMASQIGDMMESVMKRRAGVKDSSRLIPGHGGLLDRFDGVVGASCAAAVFIAIGIAG